MTKRLAGKVAVVTGASSGIGEATALALAEEGARVAVSARRRDRLDTLVARIKDAGGEAQAFTADVSQEDQANGLITQAHDAFGRLDILVNNAGVALIGPIGGADTEDWRRMIGTNVLGLMYATHAAIPAMKEQGGGHIVNVSSTAGRVARAGMAVYCASKWGVGAFSEALRQEVHKDHIRVTVIEPGMVATELTHHITDPEARRRMEERMSSITPLEPGDIAAGILYAVTQPPRVNVNEILIRPTDQE